MCKHFVFVIGLVFSLNTPFNALNKDKTILRLVNKSVDLDTQDKIVNGLNRYNAATVLGKIGEISFSTCNFLREVSRCCLSWVMRNKACAMIKSIVLNTRGMVNDGKVMMNENRHKSNGD